MMIFLTFLSLAIIFILGFFSLACIPKLFLKADRTTLIPVSWFLGSAILAFMGTFIVIIGFSGIKLPYTVAIITWVVLLFHFRKYIKQNLAYFSKATSVVYQKFHLDKTFSFSQAFLFASIAFYLIVMLVLLYHKPIWAWDSFTIWSLKAKLIYFQTFDLSYLKNHAYYSFHADYPLYSPILESYIARFIGEYNEQYSHLLYGVNLLFFSILIFSILRKLFSSTISFLFLITLITIPILFVNTISSYADGLLLPYSFLTVYFLYMYISGKTYYSQKEKIVYLSIGLLGSVLVKNEGLMLYLISLFIGLGFYYKRSLSNKLSLKRLLLPFKIGLLGLLPWLITTKVLALQNDVVTVSNIGQLFSAEGLGKITQILDYLFFSNFFYFEYWGLLFYAFFFIVFIDYRRKNIERASYFLAYLAIVTVGIVSIYIISPHSLEEHLVSSADRVTLSLLYPIVLSYLILAFHKNFISSET